MDHEAETAQETNIIFRVPVSLRERFKEVAQSDHRSMSQELRRLMELRIAEADELEKAA